MLSIIVFVLSIVFLFFFLKFIFAKKETYDNNPYKNFNLRESIENELKDKNSFLSEALKNSDEMVSSFIKKSKIRTDGCYIANKSGINKEFGINYNLFFTICFNNKGMVSLVDSENEPYIPSFQEYDEFLKFNEKNEFIKLDIVGNEIRMRFYEPDSPIRHDKGEVNPNNYREWSGIIIPNGLILNYFKSYFNYSLGEYNIEQGAKDLKFNFHQIHL